MAAHTVPQKIHRSAYTRMVTIEQKVCPTCRSLFEGIKQRRFCSRNCQAKADYEKNANHYRAKRRERYREGK